MAVLQGAWNGCPAGVTHRSKFHITSVTSFRFLSCKCQPVFPVRPCPKELFSHPPPPAVPGATSSAYEPHRPSILLPPVVPGAAFLPSEAVPQRPAVTPCCCPPCPGQPLLHIRSAKWVTANFPHPRWLVVHPTTGSLHSSDPPSRLTLAFCRNPRREDAKGCRGASLDCGGRRRWLLPRCVRGLSTFSFAWPLHDFPYETRTHFFPFEGSKTCSRCVRPSVRGLEGLALYTWHSLSHVAPARLRGPHRSPSPPSTPAHSTHQILDLQLLLGTAATQARSHTQRH